MKQDNVEQITTTPLIIRPRYEPPVHKETVASLNDMNKQEICDLSLEKFGVGMKLRTTKKELVAAFMRCQDEITPRKE
jgi:hypothetical protein